MSDAPTPKMYSDEDPVLSQLIKELQQQAEAEQTARLSGEQIKWMMPPMRDWTGELADYVGISSAFDRSFSNDKFDEATKDAQAPGTTGDLMVTTLQVDYLAIAERAFRSRHTMSRPRAVCHAMGRKRGHGNDRGPLVQAVLEFIRGLVKDGKANTQGASP